MEDKTRAVNFGMWQVMPLLVVPIVFATIVKLIHYGWSRSRLLDMTTFVAVQITSLYVWSCTGLFWLYYQPATQNQLNFSQWNFCCLFSNAINIEPINTFLYTWRFLEALESAQKNGVKKFIFYFKRISVIVVPSVYLILYMAL